MENKKSVEDKLKKAKERTRQWTLGIKVEFPDANKKK